MARPAPKRLGRPPATDSEATRRRIVDTAMRYFGDQGFDRATNSEIAQELDLTSGSIYHYFGSKAQLYGAACDHARELVRTMLTEAISGHDGFSARLGAVLDAAVELNRDHPSLAQFLTNAPTEARRNQALAEPVALFVAELAGFYADLVAGAEADGELAPGADRQSVARLIQALTFGLGQFATVTPEATTAAVLRVCQQLFQGTLFAGPQLTSATVVPTG